MPNEQHQDDARVANALAAIPWADVPAYVSMPEQLYNFEIIETRPGRWPDGEGSTGKAYAAVVCQILEPLEYRGRLHTENFTVGSDDDPYAENIQRFLNPSPSDFGITSLKRLIEFTGVAIWTQLVGKKFSAFTRNNKGKDGLREFTNLQTNQFYAIGEVLPGTPTVVSSRQRRNQTAPNGHPPITPPLTEQSCPMCDAMFPADVILEHVKQCSGKGVTA